MEEDFGSTFITITGEDGEDYELEHLDTVEFDGSFYLACLPADLKEDDENYGFVILRSVTGDDGDDYLEVPDDETTERVYNIFMARWVEEDEEEDEE